MPLTLFGAGSMVIAALHLPDCALPAAYDSGANRAAKTGADGQIVFGSSIMDMPVLRIVAARDAGVKKPTMIGGGVAADNLREALLKSNAVIDSNSLSRKGIDSDDPLRLNAVLCRRFMDQARDA